MCGQHRGLGDRIIFVLPAIQVWTSSRLVFRASSALTLSKDMRFSVDWWPHQCHWKMIDRRTGNNKSKSVATFSGENRMNLGCFLQPMRLHHLVIHPNSCNNKSYLWNYTNRFNLILKPVIKKKQSNEKQQTRYSGVCVCFCSASF